MAASSRPRIEAYIGATGSGKGVSIRRRLAELKPPRLVIWDARAEYADYARQVPTLADLVQALREAKAGPVRVRYVPGARVDMAKAFELVCVASMAAGDLVFLAEELSDVTSPSYAPPGWRQVITQGRHKGLHILGATQRPALIDKTFLGNCTRRRCGALGYENDRKVMALELDCRRDVVAGLRSTELPGGGAVMQMIEQDRQAGTLEAIELRVSAAGRVTETRKALQRR
jgi:hypothetical protein